jgi:hypothetical protein
VRGPLRRAGAHEHRALPGADLEGVDREGMTMTTQDASARRTPAAQRRCSSCFQWTLLFRHRRAMRGWVDVHDPRCQSPARVSRWHA